jgi:hypothetical protein
MTGGGQADVLGEKPVVRCPGIELGHSDNRSESNHSRGVQLMQKIFIEVMNVKLNQIPFITEPKNIWHIKFERQRARKEGLSILLCGRPEQDTRCKMGMTALRVVARRYKSNGMQCATGHV